MATALRETLINAALAAIKSERLNEGIERYPRAWKNAQYRWLNPIYEMTNPEARNEITETRILKIILIWGLSQLRPDERMGLDEIPKDAWISRTSWRPLLSVACHYGFIEVPSIPERYRRRNDEHSLENLCGLWSVGPSTIYRYMDKARQQLAAAFPVSKFSGKQLLAIRELAINEILRDYPSSAAFEYHTLMAHESASINHYGVSAWHHWKSGNSQKAINTILENSNECASTPDSIELLDAIKIEKISVSERIYLFMAEAGIWHAKNDIHKEEACLDAALQLAHRLSDRLMLGVVLFKKGICYENFDLQRSLSCYEASVENIHTVNLESYEDISKRKLALEYLGQSLVRLGWIHLRRSDPRARVVLEEASRLRSMGRFSSKLEGQLEQTLGEFWRCNGDHSKALEHKYRALGVFEQIGDKAATRRTFLNLSLIYAEMRDFEKAIKYGKLVLESLDLSETDAEVLVSAYGNIGVAYFWIEDYDRAIEFYSRALFLASENSLQEHVGNTHLNLAEAYFHRHLKFKIPNDAEVGDSHAALALAHGKKSNSTRLLAAAKTLKSDVLGSSGVSFDKLVHENLAGHYPQMLDIRDLAEKLALPCSLELQASYRLQTSKIFLHLALQERELASTIILEKGFANLESELKALQRTWAHDGNLASQLSSRWREQVGDWLTDGQRKAVLERLLAEGNLSKSSYGEAAEVSPATASKHLGLLADKGLLEQQGRGPATRYVLPSGQNRSSRDGAAAAGSPGSVH